MVPPNLVPIASFFCSAFAKVLGPQQPPHSKKVLNFFPLHEKTLVLFTFSGQFKELVENMNLRRLKTWLKTRTMGAFTPMTSLGIIVKNIGDEYLGIYEMLILSNSVNPFKKYADKFQAKCIRPCLRRVYHIPQSYRCSRNFGIFLESPPGTLVYFLLCILNQEKYSFSIQHIVAQLVKNPPAMQETWVQSLGWEDPLKKGKATHSSILARRIPWTV